MRLPATKTALAVLAGLLGIIHLALTPLAYADWSVEALWFVGTGLAIIVAAAANLMANQVTSPGRRLSLAAINLAMSCFFAAAWSVIPGPQVILGGMLFLSLAVFAIANGANHAKAS